jgi:hypothetical protein
VNENGVVIAGTDMMGNKQKIRFNIRDALWGKKREIVLHEGDVVFIPESF